MRDPRAGYNQTLRVLRHASDKGFLSKSGMMLGLGEDKDEIIKTMKDLHQNGVKILTLGQYLRPTINHLPVKKYIHPDEFAEYSEIGKNIGIEEVVAGPLIRSSYRADKAFMKMKKISMFKSKAITRPLFCFVALISVSKTEAALLVSEREIEIESQKAWEQMKSIIANIEGL